jgi:hypothetical protein
MVNTTARPQPRPRRARLLGTALGEILASDSRRVLIVGSGGLSHNPSPIFPQLADAESPVREYVAGRAGELDRSGWLQMVREKTTWAAGVLADGNLEREVGINPAWDRAFVDRLSSEPVEWVDGLEVEDLTRDGGAGAAELLIWIAVVAAAQTAGCAQPVVDLCVSTPPVRHRPGRAARRPGGGGRMNAIDPRVQAGLEIAALNALFFHRVDREAGIGVADLFTEDGIYIAGPQRAVGRAAIDEAYRARHARGARVSRHVVTNHLVLELDTTGPEPIATVASLLSLYAEDGTAPRPAAAPILVADFHDRLVRSPLGWRYLERRLTPLFLSTAVKPVLPMKEKS